MPKISVFPLENKEKDIQIEVISSNIQKTVEFNLKMINKYNIIQSNVANYSSDNLWLSEYCERNKIDDLIFGKALVQPDGSIFIEMSVFNKQKGAISLTRSETAATVLDIFYAADKLAVEMMHGFSGMHLGFGAVKFINSGDKGSYSVYIDNVAIGENIDNLSTVLNGPRKVIITQVRMFGEEILYDQTINILEDKTTEVNFSIPGFMEKESHSIAKHEKPIEENWDNKYSGKKIDKSFNELFKLLNVFEYSQTAIDKRKEVDEKFAQWNAKKESMGITRGLSILDKRVGISAYGALNIISPSYKDIESYPDKGSDNSNITPKAGIALSFNLASRIAIQTEFTATHIFTSYEYNRNDSPLIDERVADFGIFEIPVLLVLRVSPDKVFSLYAGGVFQIHFTNSNMLNIINGDEIEDHLMPFRKNNAAFAAGALFEIPLARSLFMSLDVRYTRTIQNWVDKSAGDTTYAELFLNCFHIGLGFGVKL
ncbi:MAG: PorT family protein [Spirochaetaceae bacterium]|nr:PorT family protein [Spirochaetaceae bacterium]